MSASMAQARTGYGTRFQLGDGAATFTVTVGTGGADAEATSVPVTALTGALAAGDILIFTGGVLARLTAAAAAAATTLSVEALARVLVAGNTAQGGQKFATLGELNDFTPPSETMSTFDASHYQSPKRRQQFGAGMIDPGEASFTLNWIPKDPTQNGATGLRKVFAEGKLRDFRILYPFDFLMLEEFAGVVTNLGRTAPMNDRMVLSGTIKVSGPITTYGDEPAA